MRTGSKSPRPHSLDQTRAGSDYFPESGIATIKQPGLTFRATASGRTSPLLDRRILKLRTKVTSILLSALGAELIFLAVMAALLLQSERFAEQAHRSQLIVYNSMRSVREILDCGRALATLAVLQDPDSKKIFEDAVEGLKSSRQSLKELTADKLLDLELFQKIQADSEDFITLLDDIRVELNSGGQFDQGKAQRIRKWITQYFPKSGNRLREDLDQLISRHQKTPSQRAERAREMLKGVLGLAVVFNSLLFLWLVRTFADGLTSRLSVLQDNTVRLASGSKLHPPLSGKDEVGDLDRFLHETARILREASERDRIIMNYVPSGIILCSGDLSVEFVNQTFESMTDLTLADVRGRHLSNLFAETNAILLPRGESLAGKIHDALLVSRDETSIPCEISFAQYEDQQRELILCSVLDVRSRNEIEQLKRDFLNVVSHDLRTPLTSIQISLGLLNNGTFGELSQPASECIRRTDRELVRLIKMVTDLLTVSKIESGLHLEVSKCSVRQIFEASLITAMNLLDQKGIDFKVEVVDDLFILVDEDRIIQVVVNLLSNAAKYTPGGGLIKLCAVPIEQGVRMAVTDNGSGIPEHMKTDIFEKFVQAHSSDRKIGTGLGLAICKLIVEAHGGLIGVESEEGKGCEFWIALPLSRS